MRTIECGPTDILSRIREHRTAFVTHDICFPSIRGPLWLIFKYFWRVGIREQNHGRRSNALPALHKWIKSFHEATFVSF